MNPLCFLYGWIQWAYFLTCPLNASKWFLKSARNRGQLFSSAGLTFIWYTLMSYYHSLSRCSSILIRYRFRYYSLRHMFNQPSGGKRLAVKGAASKAMKLCCGNEYTLVVNLLVFNQLGNSQQVLRVLRTIQIEVWEFFLFFISYHNFFFTILLILML